MTLQAGKNEDSDPSSAQAQSPTLRGFVVIGLLCIVATIVLSFVRLSVNDAGVGSEVDVIVTGDLVAEVGGREVRVTDALFENTLVTDAIEKCRTADPGIVAARGPTLLHKLMIVQVSGILECIPEGDSKTIDGVIVQPISFGLNISESPGVPWRSADGKEITFRKLRISLDMSRAEKVQQVAMLVLPGIGFLCLGGVFGVYLREGRQRRGGSR